MRASVTCGLNWRPSGGSPASARGAVVGARQCLERPRVFDAGPDRARLVAAEHAEPGEAQLEHVDLDRRQPVGELARLRLVDVADEAQRQVQVVRLGPAAAGQRHLQAGDLLADLVGNLDAREQARHGVRLFVSALRCGALRLGLGDQLLDLRQDRLDDGGNALGVRMDAVLLIELGIENHAVEEERIEEEACSLARSGKMASKSSA